MPRHLHLRASAAHLAPPPRGRRHVPDARGRGRRGTLSQVRDRRRAQEWRV